jgi:AraC-like DNA-binding protein
MPAHQHEAPSLNIVVSGQYCEQIGRHQRTYARGHALFCPAGVSHSQAFGNRRVRQVVLHPKQEWLEYLAECNMELMDSPHTKSAFFGQIGDRLVEEQSRPDAYSDFAREGLILELVAAFGRGWNREVARSRPPTWLLAAQEFMHANAFRRVEIKEIAAAAGRHPIHLCREFRRYFHTSIAAYQRRLRVGEAVRLIIGGQLTLTQIAHDCGFSSHAHLCREFKTQLGITPSEFRAEAGLV